MTLKLLSLVSAIAVVLLTVGISQIPDSFADHTATQPNALVSYNSGTNEVQVEWDFTNSTSGVAPETCLLKGDFWYYTDMDNAWDADQTDSDTIGHPYFDHITRITGFIPLKYSVVSSNPTIFDTLSEVIPCTGNARIDLDTVMSNPLNVFQDGVTPREDLQIFLSFYSLHEGKNFTFDNIDEIFVAYTPNVTWTQPFLDYACGLVDGAQIGNTIYIDQSAKGIHGNNGDNCNQYLDLNSNQYFDIDGAGSSSKGDHVGGLFQLLWRVTTGGGDNCSVDCRPPTLESLVFNNSPNWLAQNNQTFNIGDAQVMKFRYSDNRGIDKIDQVEIGFGLPSMYSTIYDAEIIIQINTNNEAFESLVIKDKNNLFVNSTTVTVDKINCVSNDCLELEYTLEFTWAEIPFDGYFLITATDSRGNTSYDRLTEELFVIGETLNEQPTLEIYNRSTSSMNDGLSITITRTDKVSDIWIDGKSRYWQGFGNDRFDIIPLTLAALLNNH